MITASGISSRTASPITIVRQGSSPQTEQHLLLPTLAPIHSSIGFPAIQMRFDWAESFLNVPSLISRIFRIGSTFSGLSASRNFATAPCRCWYVASQRGHVPPALTSRYQTIGNCLVAAFSLLADLSPQHSPTVPVAVSFSVGPQHEPDMTRAPFYRSFYRIPIGAGCAKSRISSRTAMSGHGPSQHTALPHELGRYRSKADVVTGHMTPPVLWVHGLVAERG